jgi:multiple sugar transport system substrate-binding protein
VSQDQPITITYWGLWEPTAVMDQVFADFQSQNPNITVEYQQQSHRDYRERLQNALASKQGPDLFRFHNTWLPMLGQYVSSVPGSVYSQADYTQTFYPVAEETLTFQGNLAGVPLMIEGLGLFYNQDILQAAGLTPPTTWEELRTVASRLTLAQGNQILRGGVALGTTSNVEHWPDIVGLMLLQNSADPAKPNNQLGQDAVTFYTLFSRTDKVWDDSLPSSTFAFATEKVAMMIAPSWRAHDVSDINPDLNFAIVPAPKLPETDIAWASFWAEGVSKGSSRAKQEAAWSLIKFLSSKETLRRFYSAASDNPGRLFGEPFSRIDMADQLTTDPLVGAYITQAPLAKSWYLASYTHDNGLNDQIIKYYEDAINAINQGETADDVLTTVEQGVAQVLSQYGLAP